MSTETPASNSDPAIAQEAQATSQATTNETNPAPGGEQHQPKAEAQTESQPPEGSPTGQDMSKTDEVIARLTGKHLDGTPAEDAEKPTDAGGNKGDDSKHNHNQEDGDEIPSSIKDDKARSAFIEQRQKTRRKISELEPFAKVGKTLVQAVARAGITDEVKGLDASALAAGVALEASLRRMAAGKATQADEQRVEQAMTRVGRKRPPAEVPVFTGELPADLKDMVAMEYCSEDDARSLMGLRIAKDQAKASQAQPPPKQPDTPVPQAGEKTPPQEQGNHVDPAHVHRLEAILADELAESGIPLAQQESYVGDRLLPKVMAAIARTDRHADPVQVWESLDPDNQFKLLMAVHQNARPASRVASEGNGDGTTSGGHRGPMHQGHGRRPGGQPPARGQEPRVLATVYKNLTGQDLSGR
jgi:hypothetical protein